MSHSRQPLLFADTGSENRYLPNIFEQSQPCRPYKPESMLQTTVQSALDSGMRRSDSICRAVKVISQMHFLNDT